MKFPMIMSLPMIVPTIAKTPRLGRAPGAAGLVTWKNSLTVGLVLLVATGLAVPAFAGSADDASLQERSFLAAWGLINDRYWDPEFGGLDWAGVRDELLPKAKEAESNAQLRDVLEEMLGRLGQSHFGVIPGDVGEAPQTSDDDDGDGELPACATDLGEQVLAVLRGDASERFDAGPGFDVRFVDGAVLVSSVDEDGPAASRGVKPGWELLSVGQQPVGDLSECLAVDLGARAQSSLIYNVVRRLLEGDAGDRIEVELRAASTGGDDVRKLELRLAVPNDAQTVRFGNLPAMQFRFSQDEIGADESEIGVIRFNVWMMPVAEAFEKAIVDLADVDGLVIDLRGNPGGVAGLAPGLAGYLVGERTPLGILKTRRDELKLQINPRKVARDGRRLETFEGPVAVLIDQFSASTSEIFAAGLQDLERARLFGERTMAAALPAVIEELPNGDYLMHALADLTRPSGGRIEGEGVVPDSPVPLTSEGLLRGVDEPLAAAMEWIFEQTDPAANP